MTITKRTIRHGLWLIAASMAALWQFEAYSISQAPLREPLAISTWREGWPADTPFMLAQEVREQFRRADAKRDAGTPVRDIASLPQRQDEAV
ncbi:hypothetical protein [Chromobacterium sp. IIBBL 290-4]|uniref:hypothetical protein n=1 Tax=Chromobacterium sp. IIBBL 290-4 TaxID=2953890 RepID=UPI0020B69DFA|nr:hypothetical protein [Chromobacterium sp. IIBBL 290-4]UTH75055.1 hypothetical protein NKT35_02835 [Chromobacterium sp. IIBBL 290-4]